MFSVICCLQNIHQCIQSIFKNSVTDENADASDVQYRRYTHATHYRKDSLTPASCSVHTPVWLQRTGYNIDYDTVANSSVADSASWQKFTDTGGAVYITEI